MSSHPEFNDHTTGEEVVAAFADKVKDRVFVITGPTAGNLGAGAATALARGNPSTIVLAGRRPAAFQSVADDINKINPNAKVILVALDLGSFASIRAAVKQISDEVQQVDVLINNAGIMAQPFKLTEDGIESQFGVNHVGHFLLTNLLLPKLSPSGVVVNVSSSGHRVAAGHYEDVNWEKEPYNVWKAYGQGKLGNILFSKSLAKRGIRSVSVHPGWIDGTQLGTHLDAELFQEVVHIVTTTPNFESAAYHKNPSEGASTVFVAAFDEKVPNGSYLFDCQVWTPDPLAEDETLAERLWEVSNKLTGEQF